MLSIQDPYAEHVWLYKELLHDMYSQLRAGRDSWAEDLAEAGNSSANILKIYQKMDN